MEFGLKWLAALLGKNTARGVNPLDNPPRPEQSLAVIGDIHGRADLLDKLLQKLARETPDALMVFVGDYVDRGPDSRGVLERLQGLQPAVCLLGNHEAMLLEFLDQPVELGARWLRNGGRETLNSYGIALADEPTSKELNKAVSEFSEVLSHGTLDWLESRPLKWKSGNLVISHAGMDPKNSTDDQQDRDLLWGHSRFLRDDRQDGLWVAHGHWVRDRATCSSGRINVDTGAWKSGRLSAALVDTDGRVRFVHAR